MLEPGIGCIFNCFTDFRFPVWLSDKWSRGRDERQFFDETAVDYVK